MAYVAKINGYDIKDAEARADLADEITARQSADTALGGKIGDEITARQSADTALGGKIGDLSELTTTATADLVAAINEVDSHADTNAANIAVIIGNDTGKSMREVAQEVSATVYTPQGSCTFANLPSLSASSTKVGFVYDVTDSFTTTSDFKEGAGIDVPAGTNIVVTDVSGTKMWDLLGFNIDLSPYQKKVMDSSVSVAGTTQTTVEGAIRALAAAMSTIDAVYPVGSIYQNVLVDTNPGTLFGVGTWEKIEGKFLYGTTTGIALGSTGGAPTVTLSVANMPEHYHTVTIGSTSGSFSGDTGDAGAHSGSFTTRSGWDGGVIPAQFYGDGVFSANNDWGGPNARTSYDSSWQGDGRRSTITLSVGDHKHSISGSISVDFGTKDTDKKGSGTAFSIIPPYVAVNIWKRTA